MNSTGKAARRRHGTRYGAKAAKPRKRKRTFGKLPVSASRGNAEQFIRDHGSPEPLVAG